MLNMQLDKAAIIDTNEMAWEAGSQAGVWRKPLAREASEHGHNTSLVRYDANTSFPAHLHPRGEEIFVLEGWLADEHGEYPAGTYLRNPPGSQHSPHSESGCVLLVKRDQFDDEDNDRLRIDTGTAPWLPGEDKLEFVPLHYHDTEMVALYRWPAGTRYQPHSHFGGEEIYVLEGTLQDEYGIYPAGTWIRNPHNSEHCPFVEEDTVIWIKTGHLLP